MVKHENKAAVLYVAKEKKNNKCVIFVLVIKVINVWSNIP